MNNLILLRITRICLQCGLLAVFAFPSGCKKKPDRSSQGSARTSPGIKTWLQGGLEQILGKQLASAPEKRRGDMPYAFTYASGTIAFGVTEKRKVRHVKVAFRGISLKKALSKTTGELLDGTLEGSGSFTVAAAGVSALTGTLTVRCVKCTVGGKVKLDPTMLRGTSIGGVVTVPELALGSVGCKVRVTQGKVTLETCSSRSADFELTLGGTIKLRAPLRLSEVDISARFRFTHELKKREPRWGAIEAGLTRMKRADGYFELLLRGRLSSVRLRPRRRAQGKTMSPPSALAPVAPRARPFSIAALRKVGRHMYEIGADAMDALLVNMAMFARGVTILPVTRHGKLEGYRLHRVAPDSICAAMGLLKGDIILAINKMRIGSVEKALQVFVKLKTARQLVLDVRRGGRRITFTLRVLRRRQGKSGSMTRVTR